MFGCSSFNCPFLDYHSKSIITNFCIQGIMVISYFPVVKRLLESKENTEPFSVWFIMMPYARHLSFIEQSALATVYSVRAIICVAVLMLLMLRVELLARKKQSIHWDNSYQHLCFFCIKSFNITGKFSME
jgi:hypothetical protein